LGKNFGAAFADIWQAPNLLMIMPLIKPILVQRIFWMLQHSSICNIYLSRTFHSAGLRVLYIAGLAAPLIYSLNLKYNLSDDLAIRASYAKGFRAPSLKELFLTLPKLGTIIFMASLT